MTDQPDEATRRAWRARIRAAGLRVTPQREAVLTVVHTHPHATADAVLRALETEHPGVNVSTIYRSLEALESVGLIRHTHLDHRAPVYHITSESPHIHLRCDMCGTVISVSMATAQGFVAALKEATGFQADIGHAAIHGRCSACAGTQAREIPSHEHR